LSRSDELSDSVSKAWMMNKTPEMNSTTIKETIPRVNESAKVSPHEEIVRQRFMNRKSEKDKLGNFLLQKLNEDNKSKIVMVMRSLVAKKVVEVEEYEIKFNFGRAFKLFIYHLLFFILGPFFSLPLIFFEGYQFVKNLGFIGGHYRLIIFQYSFTLVFVSFMI
jgi:hypothetical protein